MNGSIMGQTFLFALLASLFTYTLTAIGAAMIFFSDAFRRKTDAVLTGVASGIMVSASIFSLLIPALQYETGAFFLPVVLGFAFGGGVIVLFEMIFRLLQRKTEGHWLLVGAVALHNIPEGMAIGVAFAVAGGQTGLLLAAWSLAFGIGIQNLPEGMSVAYPLKRAGFSRMKSFLIAQGTGLVEIPACLFGVLFAAFSAGWMPWILSAAAGAMIVVTVVELVPESFEKDRIAASLGFLLGFLAMMSLDLWL
ncbi:MAG: ZIP family metal transporter [Christensenellaceae bacterium]